MTSKCIDLVDDCPSLEIGGTPLYVQYKTVERHNTT